jgi:hypothetical protein
LLGFLVVAALYLCLSWRKYYSLCGRCGKVRISSEIYARPLRRVLWVRHRQEHTEFSRVLQEHALVGEHRHVWLFAHGLNCQMGSGPGLQLGMFLDVYGLAAFIRFLAQCEDKPTVNRWVSVILDFHTTKEVAAALGDHDHPLKGFERVEEFRAWWREHRERLEERVEELRKREMN